MNKHKIILGLMLFGLGLTGILSLLTTDIPLPPEIEELLQSKFSPIQIKLLLLINPSIMLCIAVVVGVILFDKVGLKVPIIERLIGKNKSDIQITTISKFGLIGGVIYGILLGLVGLIFNPILPSEFIELGENLNPSYAMRFLYGGLTEEILMRFGFMTFIVWVLSQVVKENNTVIYWGGIILSSIMFALGHFPIAYQAVENPSNLLLLYLLIGNSIGGIIFGWLYWKKGLESAMIAHIVTHIILVLGQQLFG